MLYSHYDEFRRMIVSITTMFFNKSFNIPNDVLWDLIFLLSLMSISNILGTYLYYNILYLGEI
jgi:hypothetical protein